MLQLPIVMGWGDTFHPILFKKKMAVLLQSAIKFFCREIGAIRMFAEKTVSEWNGVWAGISIFSKAIVNVFTLTGSFAKIGIGICS